MRAIEKDRTRRYESASALAEDIQRYLDDAPVQACPPSAGYRARKFARKHRTALVCSAVVVLTLLAGVAVATSQATRALRAEKESRANLELLVNRSRRMARMLYSKEMLGATANYLHGNHDRVRDALTRYAAVDDEAVDLRGFEWYLLNGLKEMPQRPILQVDEPLRTAHQHEATGLLVVVYESSSQRAHRMVLVDLVNKVLLQNLPCRLANDLAFSPDSTLLAMIQNNDIQLRDAQSGVPIGSLSGHIDSIEDLDFHPQGHLLASVSNDGTAICWALHSRKKLWQIEAHTNRASAVVFHPLLQTLVTAGVDGMLRFWSTTSEELADEFRLVGELPLEAGGPRRISISPDGTRLVIRHGHSALTLLESAPILGRDEP